MSDRRKKSSHHRPRENSHRHRTHDDEDRYNQNNQAEYHDRIVDQRSYSQPQTVSYPPQGAATFPQQGSQAQQGTHSYLPQATTSYQASGPAVYTSQETASYQQSGISSYTSQGTAPYTPQETASYQQEETTSYVQPDETSHSGTWTEDPQSRNYPRVLIVRNEDESPRFSQQRPSHGRGHPSRQHASQRRDDTDYVTHCVAMSRTRVQGTSSLARTGEQFHSTGEPPSDGFPASHSGDFPSNDQSVSGLSSQLRRVSLSSDSYMAPMTGQSTPQSSHVGSPDGNFSEVYWTSPPTTQPRTSSRRNSIVNHGESAGLHRRRRSSEASGRQSGLLPSPGSGTRRTSTFPILEDSPQGRDEDSHTSQHGSDDEFRRTRLSDRRDSSVSFARESKYTGQDKEEQKRQKASTYEYVDQLRKTSWWNNQGGPRGPRDGDDGSGGYGNNSSYRV